MPNLLGGPRQETGRRLWREGSEPRRAPKKSTDNRRFDGIGDDPDATVQAEALAPDDLAELVTSALRRGWDEAAARLQEREEDERARLRRWFERARRVAP